MIKKNNLLQNILDKLLCSKEIPSLTFDYIGIGVKDILFKVEKQCKYHLSLTTVPFIQHINKTRLIRPARPLTRRPAAQ
jgi:hypothetical protein